MPECGNCGRHVTPGYLRVFAPDGGTVCGCPACSVSPLSAVE